MKTLTQLLREIEDERQSDASAVADVVLVLDKLTNDETLRGMLQSVKMPSDKYKAIAGFAELLGIPKQRLVDFIQQQKMQGND